MKTKCSALLQSLLFLIIPALAVLLCIVFRTAQGEKTEEVLFGILLGILLDIAYAVYLLAIRKTKQARSFTVGALVVLVAIVVLFFLGWLLPNAPLWVREHTYQTAKSYSESFLDRNLTELEEIAQESLANKQATVSEYKKASFISYDELEAAVNFEIGSQGMLGGQYWQLVYTEKGTYMGETDQYTFYEENGNNIIFAEKIRENWYFYWIDYDGRVDLSNID